MQRIQPNILQTKPQVNVIVSQRSTARCRSWQQWGIGLVAFVLVGAGAIYQRYSNPSLSAIPLKSEAVEGHRWVGQDISFQQLTGHQFDVSVNLERDNITSPLILRNIDLSLMIPMVPTTAHRNKSLVQWFLTEREFNRQRVIFKPGSPHVHLPDGLAGYAAEDISIALTNNCLGAGYWELAVYSQTETDKEKIYQGYFTFPRRAYASLVNQLNPTQYWQQARTMEGWPNFDFLSGLSFELATLRTVHSEQQVPIQDLKTEPILAIDEQVSKANLIVYSDRKADTIQTWKDIRQTELQFQSFIAPGIYNPDRLWQSDFSQLADVTQALARQIASPLTEQSLLELQLDFVSTKGEKRQLILSGIDLKQVPQLNHQDYANGVYMPLGFGTPFTQDYAELQKNRPDKSTFLSVLLDSEERVINYRQDIGINGLVMHRDTENENLLHIYLMSYERITLVGHYVVDLSRV